MRKWRDIDKQIEPSNHTFSHGGIRNKDWFSDRLQETEQTWGFTVAYYSVPWQVTNTRPTVPSKCSCILCFLEWSSEAIYCRWDTSCERQFGLGHLNELMAELRFELGTPKALYRKTQQIKNNSLLKSQNSAAIDEEDTRVCGSSSLVL